MTNGLLTNSKNTLILAGGVLVCAAIAAATLGSQFIPNSELDYRETREVVQENEGATNAAATQSTPQLADDSLNGFADDSDLIDDTSGIDTTPASKGEVIVTAANPGNEDNNGFAEVASAPAPRRGVRAKPSVFQDYNPNAGRAPAPPKNDPLPRDPPPGQPFPKDRKIIELVEPGGG